MLLQCLHVIILLSFLILVVLVLGFCIVLHSLQMVLFFSVILMLCLVAILLIISMYRLLSSGFFSCSFVASSYRYSILSCAILFVLSFIVLWFCSWCYKIIVYYMVIIDVIQLNCSSRGVRRLVTD